ncbi:MAG: hypothetical protein QOF78_3787 [Phycisphaerales bacterium]|jgi:hypothetical protein|nr:hypothetical protein [Phycisphaerales bacterium]
MWDRAIILAEAYDGDDAMRSPRIIAPLQHLFDPILGAAELYRQAWQWGDRAVPMSRFSDFPRIMFDRLPTLPENLAEAMLYHLQLRLMDRPVFIQWMDASRHEAVTILPA